MPLQSPYPQKTTKNYQKFLAQGLKDQCIGINMKQKVRIRIQQIHIHILNQNFQKFNRLMVLGFSNKDGNSKKSIKPTNVIYQKAFLKITTSSATEKLL